MARRGFNIGKLMKVSKELLYEQSGNTLYLIEKGGRIGIQTDDMAVLDELKKKGAAVTMQDGIKHIVDMAIGKKQEMYTLTNTEITFPYYDHRKGKMVKVTAFRDCDQPYSVKFIAADYADIFKPQVVTSGKPWSEPIIMVCEDCYGLIMPMMLKKQYSNFVKENMENLVKQLEVLA